VETGGEKVKTRAYDFTLPYKIAEWERKVLIQSQFYAGASGHCSSSRDIFESPGGYSGSNLGEILQTLERIPP
jgi:hypothetical protein